jgi:hypothetical protein
MSLILRLLFNVDKRWTNMTFCPVMSLVHKGWK